MAFGPAGHLYVASRGTNQVLRYDGSTGAFLGVFAADVPSANLSSPEDLAFGPDGNLYVTSQNPDCCAPSPPGILRYDGTTGAFIDIFASFPGSGGRSFAEGLVFGPDGHLYVSDRFTHSILRYNGATGAFIDDFVPSGSGGLVEPFDLVFGPDGNLYVSRFGSDPTETSVLRYDGETGAFIDNFVIDPLSPRAPAGLVFGPDGNLYLSIFVPIPFPFSSVLRYNGTTGLFIDDFVPTGIGGLSGATYLTFTPPVVQADQDEDGISNEVDGEFVGGAFTDESNLFSDHFTDQHLGGTSFGFIVDRGGLTVTVEDATNPAGLLLGASGAGGGTATVNACGIPLELTDGDSVEITCGSLTTVVLVGPIEILLDQDVVAIVPGGATATVTVVEGQFDVENSAESTAAIIVQVRGQIIELAPGSVASLPLIISSPVRIERASVKRDKKGRPDKDKFDFEGRLVLTDFAPDDEPVIVRLLDVFEETVPRGSFVRKGKKLDKLEFKAPRRTSGITKRSRSGMTDGSKSRLRTWT